MDRNLQIVLNTIDNAKSIFIAAAETKNPLGNLNYVSELADDLLEEASTLYNKITNQLNDTDQTDIEKFKSGDIVNIIFENDNKIQYLSNLIYIGYDPCKTSPKEALLLVENRTNSNHVIKIDQIKYIFKLHELDINKFHSYLNKSNNCLIIYIVGDVIMEYYDSKVVETESLNHLTILTNHGDKLDLLFVNILRLTQ